MPAIAARLRFGVLIAGAALAVTACFNATASPAPATSAPAASSGTATGAPASASTSAAPPSTSPGSASAVASAGAGPTASAGSTSGASASAVPSGSTGGSAAPATGSPEPSESPISGHMVPALEDLLPDTFNGVPLKKQSFDGTALGTDPASIQLKQFLAANGKRLADFGEAGASDPQGAGNLTFVVFRVPGLDGAVLQAAIVAATLAASPDVQISSATVAGRQVVQGTNANSTRYIYAKGDLVYGVQAATKDTANQAIALLP